MNLQGLKFAVVQASSAQLLIIQVKAQGLYQMKMEPCIGTETDNIARIRRNFRLVEHYVKHNFLFVRRHLYYRTKR